MNEQAATQHYMHTCMCTYAPMQHIYAHPSTYALTRAQSHMYTHTHISQVQTTRAGGDLASPLRFGVLACVACVKVVEGSRSDVRGREAGVGLGRRHCVVLTRSRSVTG